MARTQTEASAVRKGLADRMKPKPKQATSVGSGGAGASATAQRRIDPGKFLNPKAGYSAYGRRGQPPATRSGPTPPAPRPTTGATRPVGQTTIHGGFRGATATAGAPPTTPGRPGGRFGAWTPRVARAAPMQPVPLRQPMTAAPAPQPVPGQYQPPGRPMAPTVAVPAPMPVPGQYQTPGMPVAPTVAAPAAEPPQQEIARLQQRLAQLMQGQQVYNPTPYTGRW